MDEIIGIIDYSGVCMRLNMNMTMKMSIDMNMSSIIDIQCHACFSHITKSLRAVIIYLISPHSKSNKKIKNDIISYHTTSHPKLLMGPQNNPKTNRRR